ncbi:MAG: adenosylcobinamide-GDP ribazoletransferase [Hyphomicrobiales bacterium]
MKDFWFDLYRVVRFATRLPLPMLAREEADPIVPVDQFAPAFALCGLVVGLIGWLAGALVFWLGSSALMAAFVSIAAMVMVTGALHEDGLADFADGIGGGRTSDRKLEIMRDPRIGTYGVLALVLSVGARVAALSVLFALNCWFALAALVASQALSRGFTMLIASQLGHARPDGAAARLGRPSVRAAGTALLISAIIAAVFLMLATGLEAGLAAGLLSMLALLLTGFMVSIIVTKTARHHLGGQTGDVLGANQQGCDLAGLYALSISLGMFV